MREANTAEKRYYAVFYSGYVLTDAELAKVAAFVLELLE